MSRNFDKCKNCGEIGFLDSHKCKPVWDAILQDYNDTDEPMKTFGYEAESAALKFAEDNFSNFDYPEEMEVWVKKPDEIDWQKFYITVESVPSFTATKI